jgi:hypothetical protein
MANWDKTLGSFAPNEREWKMIIEKANTHKRDFEIELHGCQDEFLLKKLCIYQLKLLAFSKIELESDRK